MAELDGPEGVSPYRRILNRHETTLRVAIVATVFLGLLVAFLLRRERAERPTIPQFASAALPSSQAPIPAAQPPVAAPAVSSGDPEAMLRRLAGPLSSSPLWATWLAVPNLVHRLAAATSLVARDESPRPVLGFLRPSAAFVTRIQDGETVATQSTYARYDVLTRLVTTLDPARVGAAYSEMAPLFQRAFIPISRPGQSFTGVLHQAIRVLRDTPVPDARPALVRNGSTYAYADSKLEDLGPAKKLLLRMGPKNERAIQTWLAKFDQAIPDAVAISPSSSRTTRTGETKPHT
ncbi:MAG: DUF3014 domain-containing protein [Deltaproteobacteria bacterium]|nr:DUF3014 domain-containing protein [Deltaproteobacteria bacterium]